MIQNTPNNALPFAKSLQQTGNFNAQTICELFFKYQQFNSLTGFALDFLPDNVDNQNWQTLILEHNIKSNLNVAEAIFQSGKWKHYDRERVAVLCEQHGLYTRAL